MIISVRSNPVAVMHQSLNLIPIHKRTRQADVTGDQIKRGMEIVLLQYGARVSVLLGIPIVEGDGDRARWQRSLSAQSSRYLIQADCRVTMLRQII